MHWDSVCQHSLLCRAYLVHLVKEGLLDHEETKEREGTQGHQDLKAFRGQKVSNTVTLV